MTEPVNHFPSMSVVVPTYRRAGIVKKCIDTLIEQDYPPDRYEVIVVDDYPHEAQSVVESLKAVDRRVRYLGVPHGGVAAAYEAGLRHSNYDVVAFIDDDAMAPPSWLRQIASTLVNGKPQGVIGTGGHISAEYPLEKFEAKVSPSGELQWTGFGTTSSPPCEVDHLPGCNMAFWRDAVVEIGGFDTRFSKRMSWRNETDVCLRLRQQGYRLIYDPQLTVLHRGARWNNLLERLKPTVVWNMIRDDSYFRAKNFGLAGAVGAMQSSLRRIPQRLLYGTSHLFLAFVHMAAWIPGTMKGLVARRQAKSAAGNR